jgi:hypothetical protein
MAQYRVTAPDGSVIVINGPEGATDAEIQRQAQALYKPQAAPKAAAKAPPKPIPSKVDRVLLQAWSALPHPVKYVTARMSNAGAQDAAKAQERAEAGRQARAAPAPPLGSRIIPDLVAPFQGAVSDIGEGYRRFQEAPQGNANPFSEESRASAAERNAGVNQTLGGIVGVPFSLVGGPMNALAGLPARGAERIGLGDETTNRESLLTATMGLRPGGPIPVRPPALPPRAPAAQVLANRGRINAPEARARAAEMRAAGGNPNLTAVVGDRGRRVIRAVGATNPVAGETLANRAVTSTANVKPAISGRAQQIAPDGRTAEQYLDDVFRARDEAASAQFQGPYAQQVPLDEATMSILSDGPGRAALQRARTAAVLRQDGGRIAEIDALLAGEPLSVSAGTLHRAEIAMRNRGIAAGAQPGGGDLASGWRMREGQIGGVLDDVEGLGPARDNYRAQSQAIGVLEGEGRNFLNTHPADYQAWFQGLSPEAQQANRYAIRQQIQDSLGGQRPNTMGTIEQMALSEYGPMNLRAALGQEGEQFVNHARMQLEQMRADGIVSPGAGSRTAVLDADMRGLDQAGAIVNTGANLMTGRWGAAARGLTDWWRSRGIPDNVAEELTRMASDPARLDEALAALERAVGPSDARLFLQSLTRPEVLAPAVQSSAGYQGR